MTGGGGGSTGGGGGSTGGGGGSSGAANGTVCTNAADCASGNCSEDFSSTTRYCAPAGSCANGMQSQPSSYQLCASSGSSYRQCNLTNNQGTWSPPTNAANAACTATDSNAGYTLGSDASCASGAQAVFTPGSCQSCGGFVPQSTLNACRTSCSQDGDCSTSSGFVCDYDGARYPAGSFVTCTRAVAFDARMSAPQSVAYNSGTWVDIADMGRQFQARHNARIQFSVLASHPSGPSSMLVSIRLTYNGTTVTSQTLRSPVTFNFDLPFALSQYDQGDHRIKFEVTTNTVSGPPIPIELSNGHMTVTLVP
ncbi:MAG: hypothetical protein ACOZQL_12005 [Myxococcota bacterium]